MANSGVNWNRAKLKKKALTIAKAGMNEAAEYAVGEVKEMLSKPGTGRVYKSRRTRSGHILHTASVPGQPPAPDTGTLRRSITKRIKVIAGTVYGYVGTKLGYGEDLEYGTRRVAARPFLRPVVHGKGGAIAEAFKRGAKRMKGVLG